MGKPVEFAIPIDQPARLDPEGTAEVGTHTMTPMEIAAADSAGKLRVDANGLGFVSREWLARWRAPFSRPEQPAPQPDASSKRNGK